MTPDILKTPIPPGIAAPDRVETRLGTLTSFDGFPDNATAAILLDTIQPLPWNPGFARPGGAAKSSRWRN